ncbi:MAG: hypothetical protein IJ728_03170 [Selenomonadaceae bacterium]|nr:hypothetical protein [Selenomonadaceae bacterium]
MIEIKLDSGQLHSAELKLAMLSKDIAPVLRRSAKRAATHAKKIGSQRVRSVYTIDGSLKAGFKGIRTLGMGAELLIASPRKSVQHYKAKQNRRGVYVSIKRGGGNIVSRSFANNGTFFQRLGRSRLPIKALYGPAVPQLFENPAIQTEIEQAALKKYEERVAHELERMIGG